MVINVADTPHSRKRVCDTSEHVKWAQEIPGQRFQSKKCSK